MDARERFAAARRIFLAAGEHEGEERSAFLARECAGDEALLREVRALLEAERRADPRMDQPALASLLGLGNDSRAAGPETIGEFKILGVL
ncbi:MAG: hypothetical protein HOP15_17450, partial [Planctomycetes bacterium]|nr:hypothetical protein [Planctomycetota bacterium]